MSFRDRHNAIAFRPKWIFESTEKYILPMNKFCIYILFAIFCAEVANGVIPRFDLNLKPRYRSGGQTIVENSDRIEFNWFQWSLYNQKRRFSGRFLLKPWPSVNLCMYFQIPFLMHCIYFFVKKSHIELTFRAYSLSMQKKFAIDVIQYIVYWDQNKTRSGGYAEE